MLNVSELKKRLNNVSLKGHQDPSSLLEELAVYAYSETAVTLETHDLIGAVFGAAPEKYNTALKVTADIKGKYLDIDDLEKVMYTHWRQGGGTQC
jgi:hypothetical protein